MTHTLYVSSLGKRKQRLDESRTLIEEEARRGSFQWYNWRYLQNRKVYSLQVREVRVCSYASEDLKRGIIEQLGGLFSTT